MLPGRDQQMATLSALVRTGGALLVHGPLGIGKTALLRYAAGQAEGLVVETAGYENESAIPFAALHDVVRRLAPGASRLLGPLEAGLAVPAQVLRLFVACDRPVLCIVDDAHLLDRQSLDVLTFVARRVRNERVCLLFGWCDDESPPVSGIPALRLPPLDRSASEEILRASVSSPDVRAILAEAAHGNPRALMDLAAAPTPVLPPEGRLFQAYQARLDRLPMGTRWLVLLAATESDVDILGRADDLDALEPAERAGIVRIVGGTVVFPQPLMRSVAYESAPLAQRRAAHRRLAEALDPATHPLQHFLHVAATVTGRDDRLAAQLERAAGNSASALERAAQLTTDPALAAGRMVAAARLAWRAGEPARARILLRRVDTEAVDVQAESRVLAGEIELRAGIAGTARRTFLAAAGELVSRDRQLALGALMRAGEALCLAGGYSRYPDIARRARALRQPAETPAVAAMFDYFDALSATFQGDHRRALGPSKRLLAVAPTMADADTLTRTSMAAIFRGDEAEAHRLATRAARIARTTNDVPGLPQAMEVVSLAEFALGRFDNLATALDGLRLARNSGQGTLASNYLALLAATAAMTGDRETCRSRLREAADLTTGRAKAFAGWALAVLDLAEGRYEDVVRHLRGIITDRGEGGHLIVHVAATPHLVEAAVRCGRHPLAQDALRMYDSWAESTRNPHWLALSSRCHALLAGSAAEAEARFGEALERHRLSPNEFDTARTGLLYGQYLRRKRKPKAAREILHSALSTFNRFDARPWAERATAELRAAGHPVETRATTGELTPHQEQIALLVAEGATNREVAARMMISPRTVDHHLRNIFAKLGIRSRVELTKLMR
ncbi:LuxR C-terminal-related transcriptional regulator [Actinocrispum sp. NPDC049592]|uniref:helix-turn-helix transcriptional regulator n=1 Tax=Actinocrispum sp. NPDC049592 TaxID=3154835 RepID=UPI00343E6868